MSGCVLGVPHQNTVYWNIRSVVCTLVGDIGPTPALRLVATCANWIFNVLFSQVSTLAITNISWKYYLVFICLNAVDFVVIALFFPETKGASSAYESNATRYAKFIAVYR
jgi:hypothetical protein